MSSSNRMCNESLCNVHHLDEFLLFYYAVLLSAATSPYELFEKKKILSCIDKQTVGGSMVGAGEILKILIISWST